MGLITVNLITNITMVCVPFVWFSLLDFRFGLVRIRLYGRFGRVCRCQFDLGRARMRTASSERSDSSHLPIGRTQSVLKYFTCRTN